VWVAPYNGLIGNIIALVILVAAVVLWLTNQLDPKLCALFAGLALAHLL
jgi:hypothetical protein